MTRLVISLLAYFFLALAIIGIFLPGFPTVPFLLLAAWCSAKGSGRLHRWLYRHPYLGKLLMDWDTHGAISRTSKLVAIAMLSLSWVLMYQRIDNIWLLASATMVLVCVGAYLASRPEPR